MKSNHLLLTCSLAPSLSAFKRVYGDVIARSRDRGASDDERLLGQERSQCVSSHLIDALDAGIAWRVILLCLIGGRHLCKSNGTVFFRPEQRRIHY